MDRSAEFNNAGVRLLDAGRIDEARDCFRAALEFRINSETLPPPQQVRGNNNAPPPRCVTPEIVFLAEHHLAHMDSYLQYTIPLPSECPGQSSPGSNNSPVGPTLQRRAFLIEPDTAPLQSAITVYNLALSHQAQDRSAWKARIFYELAFVIMLLQGAHSEALNTAITNNLQVWSSDNPDISQNGGTAALSAAFNGNRQSRDLDDQLLTNLLQHRGS